MLVVKIPAINGLGKTGGCEKAPNLLCKELNISCDEIEVNNDDIEENIKIISEKATDFLNKDFVVFLGGDHSISFPLVRAFSSLNKNVGIIIFDAHADCMKPMKEPTHEEWLRALVEQGFDPKNITLIGLRKVEQEEMDFLKEKGIKCFFMKELFSDFKETVDLIIEKAYKFDSLYLSIDIDVIDPTFAPGTGYIEPGGLSSKEFLYMIQRLVLLKNLKAVDLVEINPDKDINNLTIKLGTKIIEELKK
ncbi:MAG: arginase family protein [Candidatus Pacearchaeota archaeon]|nr:MAG: arginase family protein [Candidatus Pacearchaeota archaeon]